MKKHKIIFWVIAWAIFLFEGVMPALTFRSPMAVQGITGLGYPVYFGNMLAAFKVLGSILLVLPQVKGNIKEWVFAGFGFDFICASISMLAVAGLTPIALFPAILFVLLAVAHNSYHKMNQ